MNENLTDVTFLVDRSGSMSSKKTFVENAINELIGSQKVGVGVVNLTVVEFDSINNNNYVNSLQLNTIINNQPIQNVNGITLNPRGGTPLLDAICTIIDDTGERLSSLKEEDRPSKVVFVIVSDGEENTSCKFTRRDVKQRISRQEKQYNWLFMYVGCDHDALKEANDIGIKIGKALNFMPSAAGIKNLGTSLEGKLTAVRGMSGAEYTSYNASADVFNAADRDLQK